MQAMLGQQIANGVASGLVYGLLALGFSLAYATTRVINFAHGDIFAVGAFVGLSLQQSAGLPFPVAALIAILLVAISATIFAYSLLWRLRTTLERSVATIALALILRDGMLLLFGSDSASFGAVFPEGSIHIGTVAMPRASLVIMAASLCLLASFWWLSGRTRWGLWMRATAQDAELAAANGIPTRSIQAIAFGLGSSLAAAAGLLIGPAWQMHYAVGTVVGVKAFTAAMLGGLGHLTGALAGGLLLGVAEAILAGYGSSAWKDLTVYACLLAVLLLAPRGLFAMGKRRLG